MTKVNDVLSQLPDESLKLAKEASDSARNIARKILTTSATSLSVAFVGVVGYVLYKSYKANSLNEERQIVEQPDRSSAVHLQMLNDIQDPDIGRGRRSRQDLEEIEKRLDELKLSDEILRQVMDILDAEMDKGLRRSTNGEADVKMLPTYVCHLPTGKETNDILSLDLGGSNFRVLLIRLRANEEPQILNKVFIVSESIMKGPGSKVKYVSFPKINYSNK